MLKRCFMFFRSFLLAPFILYIFNLMAVSINVYIPYNVITVAVVGFFGISGLLFLVIILLLL